MKSPCRLMHGETFAIAFRFAFQKIDSGFESIVIMRLSLSSCGDDYDIQRDARGSRGLAGNADVVGKCLERVDRGLGSYGDYFIFEVHDSATGDLSCRSAAGL